VPVTITGEGARVIGLQVRRGLILHALALAGEGNKATKFAGDLSDGSPERLVDPKRLLLGVEYRLGDWFGEKCIAQLVPIFRRDAPATVSQQILARDDYAVGAANVVVRNYVDAVQLVYMRVLPGRRLDPEDTYTSEWIGYSGEPTSLTGNGARVVGISVKENWGDVSAVALVTESEPP
jgi:hypothetical protein